MWSKTGEKKASATTSPIPSAQHPAAAGSPAAPNMSAGVSKGIKIKGEITGREDFFLDGAFEGKIHIDDGSFTVGPNGRVNADVEAREIIVHGEMIGTLKGERVQVSSTGRVTGDMEARGIVIEDGAVLRSKVQGRREDQPPQVLPSEVPPRSKEAAAAAGAQGKSQEP